GPGLGRGRQGEAHARRAAGHELHVLERRLIALHGDGALSRRAALQREELERLLGLVERLRDLASGEETIVLPLRALDGRRERQLEEHGLGRGDGHERADRASPPRLRGGRAHDEDGRQRGAERRQRVRMRAHHRLGATCEISQRVPRVVPVSSTTAVTVVPTRSAGSGSDEKASITAPARARPSTVGEAGAAVTTSTVSEYSVRSGRTAGAEPASDPGSQTFRSRTTAV